MDVTQQNNRRLAQFPEASGNRRHSEPSVQLVWFDFALFSADN